MARSYPTDGSADRIRHDRYDAAVGSIGFVLHRHRPAHWAIRDVANPRYDILAFALSGRANYLCGNDRFEATRGTMLFFPRGVNHSARSDPQAPWSFYSLGIELLPADDDARRAFDALPRSQKLANVPQITDYFRQIERLWRMRDPGFLMACRGLALLLMQQYAAAAERAGRRVPHAAQIESLIAQMHSNVGRIESVSALARRAGLSESRFRLLFHQLTGSSVTRYQNRLRIQAAQDLLAGGQYRVSAVAAELGFRDVYYFSRLFKRMTGRPPSAVAGRRIVQQRHGSSIA